MSTVNDYHLKKWRYYSHLLAIFGGAFFGIFGSFGYFPVGLSATIGLSFLLIDFRKVLQAYLFDPSYGPAYRRLAIFDLIACAISILACSIAAYLKFKT
jgi:hypothetical protein